MSIKPIRTAADHAAALKEIERLWDKAQPGTPEGDAFEVLSTLVNAYEREHIKIPAPDPISAILFRMEQEGLTAKDLIPIFRTRARVSEVLAKKRRLNLPMIRRLHKALSIPFESLMREYKLQAAKSVQRRSRSTSSKAARRPRSRELSE